MTQTDQSAAPQKLGADKIILGLLAVLVFGALFYVMSQRQQVLRSSPAGLDGLQVWLSSEGLNTQTFTGGWRLNPEGVGLLIVPLYDTALNADRAFPQSKEELIKQQDEYDLTVGPIRSKADKVPVLVVLPKWRSGMRLTRFAHPFLLVEPERLEKTLDGLLVPQDGSISYSGRAFTRFQDQSGDSPQRAELYAAQMFSATGCTPILGTTKAMILGACPMATRSGEKSVFVLSDPDLINNHGLSLGDNAFVIRDFLAEVAGDQQIIIDYSRKNWLAREANFTPRDRTWADLMRFFAPPFTLMWVGFAIAAALTLWRAAVRFGPLLTGPDGLGASKMMAIGARARLMRLSNRDGALVTDYSKARLAATATALFGAAHARQFASPEAFLAYTKRRHPKHAQTLAEVLNIMRSLPHGAPPAQAMAAVADLDRVLKDITHDT